MCRLQNWYIHELYAPSSSLEPYIEDIAVLVRILASTEEGPINTYDVLAHVSNRYATSTSLLLSKRASQNIVLAVA